MNTSEYMDKQIMDLSKSQPNDDFINLINHQEDEEDQGKKEEIYQRYDFKQIRPISQQPGIDCGIGRAPVWNSAESVSVSTDIAVRNYSSLDSIEPAKGIPEKDQNVSNAALVSELDRTMKKHVDNLMHALEGVSARICQLESRSRNLEYSVDDLKVAVGNNQGITDGKLRQLENILRGVQSGVQVIRDKQDILKGQLPLGNLQGSQVEQQSEPQGHTQPNSFASASLQSHHQQPLPPTSISPLNAPPPAPQQSLPPPIYLPNQYPPPQGDPYYPPASQPQETATQQYQPSPPLPPQQLPQYPPAPPQQHPSLSSMNPHQQHPFLSSMNPSHHPEDSHYPPPQSYHPSLRHPGHPPNAANSSSQHFYGSPSNIYDPPSSIHGSGYSGPNEPPPYTYGGPPSQYIGGGTKQHMSSSSQLPTARVLPQALPTASGVGDGLGGSSGTGNRVPIDDVVDKVTNMGFSRDQVRATVRKLTENGQSVDLNIVLDKLMNDGVEAQPPRGWFGRQLV